MKLPKPLTQLLHGDVEWGASGWSLGGGVSGGPGLFTGLSKAQASLG